jgi:hypothetical protein
MISSLVAGLVLVLGQDEPKDVQLGVLSIQSFAEWVHQETGDLVIVSPEIAERDVYINVKQRRVDEVIGFVETAADLKVLHQNGAVTFLPQDMKDKSDIKFWEKNVEKLSINDFSESGIEKGVTKLVELKVDSASANPKPTTWQELVAMNRYEPAMAILQQVLLSLGREGAANLPENERVVFSTQPTRFQRAWPTKVAQQLQWLNEVNKERNALIRQKFEEKDLDVDLDVGGSDRPICAMMMVIRREGGYIRSELSVYDALGYRLDVKQADFWTGYDPEKSVSIDFMSIYSELKGELELEPSMQKELKRSLGITSPNSQVRHFDREDLEYISTWDRQSPLAGAASKILDYGCEVTGNEVVKEIYELTAFSTKNLDRVTAQEAARTLWNFSSPDDIKTNSLIVPEPEAITDLQRKRRIPRVAIARVAQHLLKVGSLDIDTLADGVLSVKDRALVGTYVRSAMQISGQSAGDNHYEPGQWDLFSLEVYARLPKAERALVKREAGLTLVSGRLPADIQEIFDDHLRHMDVEATGPTFDDEDSPDKYYGKWIDEQTVFLTLPEALPATLHLSFLSEKGILSNQVNDGMSFLRMCSAEELGEILFWMEQPMNAEDNAKLVSSYAVAASGKLTLEVQFGDWSGGTHVLEHLLTPVRDFVPFDKLPESVRKDVLADKAKFAKKIGQSREIGGDSKKVPPPGLN